MNPPWIVGAYRYAKVTDMFASTSAVTLKRPPVFVTRSRIVGKRDSAQTSPLRVHDRAYPAAIDSLSLV